MSDLKKILEAILMASRCPVTAKDLYETLHDPNTTEDQVEEALAELQCDYQDRAFELVEVASGWRIQIKIDFTPWVQNSLKEKPPKYSPALMETLALIVYQQPITRGEIESVRGVALSSNILQILMDNEWIRISGYRETPGRPALYITTKKFLDDFGLKNIKNVPELPEITKISE